MVAKISGKKNHMILMRNYAKKFNLASIFIDWIIKKKEVWLAIDVFGISLRRKYPSVAEKKLQVFWEQPINVY